jgi:hypothetical protein
LADGPPATPRRFTARARRPSGRARLRGRGKKDKAGKPTWIERNEWRCTTQPGKLFFTLLQWPAGEFTLPKFSNKVTRAYLLADPSHAALRIAAGRVVLPDTPPGPLAPVLCVEIEGAIATPAANR